MVRILPPQGGKADACCRSLGLVARPRRARVSPGLRPSTQHVLRFAERPPRALRPARMDTTFIVSGVKPTRSVPVVFLKCGGGCVVVRQEGLRGGARASSH